LLCWGDLRESPQQHACFWGQPEGWNGHLLACRLSKAHTSILDKLNSLLSEAKHAAGLGQCRARPKAAATSHRRHQRATGPSAGALLRAALLGSAAEAVGVHRPHTGGATARRPDLARQRPGSFGARKAGGVWGGARRTARVRPLVPAWAP